MPTPKLYATALLAIGLGACSPIPQSTAPPAAVKPQVTQVKPNPPENLPPQPLRWIDAPATLGDWQYSAANGSSFAMFGEPGGAIEFMFRCDLAPKKMSIARAGSAASSNMKILTETAERALTASPVSSPSPLLVAEISAQDPLLDAMALSYGRFAVEASGQPTLYLPSWAEISRVIEDCR